MKYGINIPNFGWFGNIQYMIDLAIEVEESGWDGLFLWDHMLVFDNEDMVLPFMEPWIGLTAIAANTKKIKLGPLVTPIPRRRPWKLARECVTLDYLSNGRLILGVGMTWWLENINGIRANIELLRERIRNGPPRS